MGEALERVRGQIGYCGIWCGGCAVGNGALSELSSRYGEQLRAYGAPHWTDIGVEWERFLGALGRLENALACAGCRRGGGREGCELRKCARARRVEHCGDCPEFGHCAHEELLSHMRTGAAAAGMAVLAPGETADVVQSRWEAAVRTQWPCCVLFVAAH